MDVSVSKDVDVVVVVVVVVVVNGVVVFERLRPDSDVSFFSLKFFKYFLCHGADFKVFSQTAKAQKL